MHNIYNPAIHHRHSIRLKGYDYSQAGLYFVTICVQKHYCLLGKIIDGKMILNEYGEIVQMVWNELPQHYSNVQLDEFIVMPNHIHGIIIIANANNDNGNGNGNVTIGNTLSATNNLMNALPIIL
ncbi:hypothetical protein R83H12_02307 [Fibrobacteria bacterium R8-3-H12]